MKKLYFNGKLFNVSKRFDLSVEDDNELVVCTGSASDIRKIVRALEKSGYYNLFAYTPIFRERHDYVVTFPEWWSVGNRCYDVCKVHKHRR